LPENCRTPSEKNAKNSVKKQISQKSQKNLKLGLVSRFGIFYVYGEIILQQMAKRSQAAILRRLEAKLKRKAVKAAKIKAKAAIKSRIEQARKKLRGY